MDSGEEDSQSSRTLLDKVQKELDRYNTRCSSGRLQQPKKALRSLSA
jgi:hypothetical protein